MNGNHFSERDIRHFMRALDEATPYDDARVPSSRLIWLKARWEEKWEREERAAGIRLLIEGIVQVFVGAGALGTGIYYWPEIHSLLADMTSAVLNPNILYPTVAATAAVFMTTVCLFGTRMMMRG